MGQKRVLAIHDISGVGKCSLTVALPIISCCGVEASVMPTAVLSTHTGGFENLTFRDLNDDIMPIVKHYEDLKINFDGIYTGFLGSIGQIKLICNTIDRLKNDATVVIVDPVMADNGKLYSIFDMNFALEMKSLCQKANIIIPNMTEASLLINEDYVQGPYKKEYIEHVLNELSKLGCEKVVLTGVYFDELQLGAAIYDAKTKNIDYVFGSKIEGDFHGTGDVFGRVLTGAILKGHNLKRAVEIAVIFTVGCIERTIVANTERRYGVDFENGFESLINLLKEY